jgi:hypothetical protein
MGINSEFKGLICIWFRSSFIYLDFTLINSYSTYHIRSVNVQQASAFLPWREASVSFRTQITY